MTANDELVGIMTALLELGLKEDKIFSDLEKKLLSSLSGFLLCSNFVVADLNPFLQMKRTSLWLLLYRLS